MPPSPRTAVTSYRPSTTSPTFHSVSGFGASAARVGAGAPSTAVASGSAAVAGASSCVAAGAAPGIGTVKRVWQRGHFSVLPATPPGTFARRPQPGQLAARLVMTPLRPGPRGIPPPSVALGYRVDDRPVHDRGDAFGQPRVARAEGNDAAAQDDGERVFAGPELARVRSGQHVIERGPHAPHVAHRLQQAELRELLARHEVERARDRAGGGHAREPGL